MINKTMFEGSKAVKTIFYINIVSFLIFLILDPSDSSIFRIFSAWNWKSDNFLPFQLITYQFLHVGLLHLIFNMLVFVSLAPPVEEYLGEKKFWIYYLMCGISSAILHMSMTSGNLSLVGASGSIWGIMVISAFLSPNQLLYIIFFPVKAKYLICTLFAFEFILCIFGERSSTSHWGHVGGAISGGLFFLYEKYKN
jgi:membrane associated rhomboid family serine protease